MGKEPFDSSRHIKYAFKFYQDENNNKKIDTNWIGIPKKEFGFSNNPRMTFDSTSFEK